MPGGRPRKPDELKILDGSWRPDRDGSPSSQAVADGDPKPPPYLKGEALAFWNQVVPGLVDNNVAKTRDSAELALMCEWWGRLRKFTRQLDRMKGNDKRLYQMTVLVSIATDKFDKIASRFGLTPADRAKLRIPEAANKRAAVPSRKRG